MDTSTKDATKRSFIPLCWQMSRCRPAVRLTCPNYIDRMTCWKRRSGCFCDRELANYLMANVDSGSDAQEVIDMEVDANKAGIKSEGSMRYYVDKSTRRPWKVQKRLCYACPLFTEHQEYKYKNLHWISLPITVGLAVALFQFFDIGYKWTTLAMANEMNNLAKHGLSEVFSADSNNSLANSSFEYVVYCVLALLLLSFVIQFVEKFFLEWKM
jgi:hypothetical protein